MRYMHHKIVSYLRKHKRPLYQKLVLFLLSRHNQTQKINIKIKRNQHHNKKRNETKGKLTA